MEAVIKKTWSFHIGLHRMNLTIRAGYLLILRQKSFVNNVILYFMFRHFEAIDDSILDSFATGFRTFWPWRNHPPCQILTIDERQTRLRVIRWTYLVDAEFCIVEYTLVINTHGWPISETCTAFYRTLKKKNVKR